jgi:hypothetical protein
MPRFFFNVFDDVVLLDDEGIELPDTGAARAAAVAGARAMMCDQVRQGRLALHHKIEVEDESRRPLFTVEFGEAVVIEAASPDA